MLTQQIFAANEATTELRNYLQTTVKDNASWILKYPLHPFWLSEAKPKFDAAVAEYPGLWQAALNCVTSTLRNRLGDLSPAEQSARPATFGLYQLLDDYNTNKINALQLGFRWTGAASALGNSNEDQENIVKAIADCIIQQIDAFCPACKVQSEKPKGSYGGSCQGCTWDGSTLSCDCRDIGGNLKKTTYVPALYRNCFNVGNNNGNLQAEC